MTVEIISSNFRISSVTPSPLIEGSTGNKAVVTVKNESVYTGTTIKAPYTFDVAITIQIPDGSLPTWGNHLGTLSLAAGATGTYTWTFSIPSGAVAGAGRAYASIYETGGANPFNSLGNATPVAVTVNAAAGTTVNVTLRAKNAPANARYWMALCSTYQSSNFIPIANPIAWNNIPANTSQQWVIFGCYDVNYQPISTPSAWHGVGFSTPFVNGKTYYWDFATGILLDEYFNWM